MPKIDLSWATPHLRNIIRRESIHSSQDVVSIGEPILTLQESKIMKMLVLDEMSQAEIGREFGVNSERVRQIRMKATKKLLKLPVPTPQRTEQKGLRDGVFYAVTPAGVTLLRFDEYQILTTNLVVVWKGLRWDVVGRIGEDFFESREEARANGEKRYASVYADYLRLGEEHKETLARFTSTPGDATI